MLLERVITAVVGGSIFLFFLYLGGCWTLSLAMILSGLGIFEASEIIFERKKLISIISGILGSGMCLLYLLNPFLSFFAMVIFLAVVIFSGNKRLRWISVWLAYFPLALSKLVVFRDFTDGFFILLSLLALTWSSDTAAYFIGLKFGKRKLWAEISPGKTWEGTIAGILTGTLIFTLFSYFLISKKVVMMTITGFILSLATVIGDLFESRFKRTFNVKDSGKILPGHGGVLDRFDSLAFTLLTFSVIARLIG